MALEQLNQMARLVERNWCAAWASLGQARAQPPTIVDDLPDFLRIYTPDEPETLLNMVIRYAGPEPVTAADVERVIAPYRQHGLPFQWWLTRGMEPQGMREQLNKLGMETWGGATMMLLPLSGWAPQYPPVNATVSLGPVGSSEDMAAAIRIICDVFYIPMKPMLRWTALNPMFGIWLARLGDQPVAALATLRDGDTVGVYHVATLMGARRRGIAGNLLILALRQAQEEGCQWATLTATPEARPLYERLGFQSCGMIEQWMPGPRLMRALAGAPTDGYYDDYW